MAHERKRHLQDLVQKTLSFSPIVGLLGHRQVGKTTLASRFAKKYFTLDISTVAEEIKRDPLNFLESIREMPIVLDECQMVPELFPALKERVRIVKKPGQYLLTGSVRFTSRKLIRESLTGRIVNWELLPMDFAELEGWDLPDQLIRLFNSSTLEIDLPSAQKNMMDECTRYLDRGGLPGMFSIRDPNVRNRRFETQIETLLERDLKLVSETNLPYRSIRDFAVHLAGRQGLPFEPSEASRSSRISVPVIKKLLAAFESIFLVRAINPIGDSKKITVYFEDAGEASHLRTQATSELMDWERYIYSQIRTQWIYRPEFKITLNHYRTRNGSYVPFVISNGKNRLGILPILEAHPNNQALGSANSLMHRYPGTKVVFVHPGKKDWQLGSHLRIVGAYSLLGPKLKKSPKR